MMKHVVIIGGGFAGLAVAKGLRKALVEVTVVDRSNHHLFQPLLYQVATAGLSPADIAVPIRSILSRQENTEVIMGEVTGVRVAEREVVLTDRKISYDYLVLATGAHHSYFGNDSWEANAPGLKTIKDAILIRRKILTAFEAAEVELNENKRKELLTFIVVGGGPTGVELAGSIGELARYALRSDFRHIDPIQTRVLLIEAGTKILATFPDSLIHASEKKLKDLGVEIRTQSRVEKIDSEGVVVGGERIASRSVIWAAGVIASPAAQWIGAPSDRAGRIQVLPDLTVPGHPNIYALGDLVTLQQEGRTLPGVAPVAMQEGRYVGESIAKRLEGATQVFPFRYVDKGNLATVGRSFAVADFGKLKVSGWFAWMVWVVVHIYYLIGFRNRFIVVAEWAWNYLTFKRGARLITD